MSNFIKITISYVVASVFIAAGVGLIDEGEIAIFMLVCGAVAVLYSQWIIAESFSTVAREKGYYEKGLTLFIFITSFIGFLYVISLPNRNTSISVDKKFSSDELPEL